MPALRFHFSVIAALALVIALTVWLLAGAPGWVGVAAGVVVISCAIAGIAFTALVALLIAEGL